MNYQHLDRFSIPDNFRGRPAWQVQLWWIVQATLFGWSPQFLYAWRRFLLRSFGARIGKAVLVRPTARITYPWKVSIGDYSWIGDDVVLYSLDEIEIGSRVSPSCGIPVGTLGATGTEPARGEAAYLGRQDHRCFGFGPERQVPGRQASLLPADDACRRVSRQDQGRWCAYHLFGLRSG